jgi:hypothetical protein
MSLAKLPSGQWVDLKMVRIIRTEILASGGPCCTVMTGKGNLPVFFDTLQEASSWMVEFGDMVKEFRSKAAVFHSRAEATNAKDPSS